MTISRDIIEKDKKLTEQEIYIEQLEKKLESLKKYEEIKTESIEQ